MRLKFLKPLDSCSYLPYVSMGSGSLAATAILEAKYFDDMTVNSYCVWVLLKWGNLGWTRKGISYWSYWGWYYSWFGVSVEEKYCIKQCEIDLVPMSIWQFLLLKELKDSETLRGKFKKWRED